VHAVTNTHVTIENTLFPIQQLLGNGSVSHSQGNIDIYVAIEELWIYEIRFIPCGSGLEYPTVALGAVRGDVKGIQSSGV
jgi:hypothetical protein